MDLSFLEVGSSYEQFLINSKLSNVLNIKLMDSTMTSRARFVDALATAPNQKSIDECFVDVVASNEAEWFPSATDNKAYIDLMEKNIFNRTIDLFPANNILPSIDMHIDNKPLPDVYLSKLQDILGCMFVNMIAQIEHVCDTSQSSYCASFSSPGVNVHSEVISKIKKITASLQESLVDDMAPTFTQYVNNIYIYFTGGVFVEIGLSQAELNLMFVVLTPLFQLLYLSHYLPTKTLLAGGSTQRNAQVRRKAIINIYKIFMYTLYSIYRKAIVRSPSASYTLKLQQILDSFINDVIHPDFKTYKDEYDNVMKNEMSRMKGNMNISTSIKSDSRSIELLRSQISNIVVNKSEYDHQLRWSIATKWLWFSFLIFYLIIFVLSFLLMKKLPWMKYVFGIVSVAIVIMLSIISVFSLAKNYI
jgi:hypothetical protein